MDKKNTRLILARHGETEENKLGIMQGNNPGNLSKEGKAQAYQLALSLMNEDVDIIVCSKLKRSYDTAKIIASVLGKDIDFLEILREKDWGEYTGKSKYEVDWEVIPDGMETNEELYLRGIRVINEFNNKYHNKNILAVGHGAINRAIQAYLQGFNADMISSLKIMDNASFTKYDISNVI